MDDIRRVNELEAAQDLIDEISAHKRGVGWSVILRLRLLPTQQQNLLDVLVRELVLGVDDLVQVSLHEVQHHVAGGMQVHSCL